MEIVIYIVAGAIFGIIGGMGLGGGIVLIPALTLLLGIDQHHAQGLNLVAFVPMAIAALIVHFKKKNVVIDKGIIMSIGGVLGAISGALLVSLISSPLLTKIFGGFLIFLGGFRWFKRRKQRNAEHQK